MPVIFPHASANVLCTSWKPLPSRWLHGSSQMETRSCTLPSRFHATNDPTANRTPPMASQLRRSVATHSSTTNRAKNSSDEPRSFWPTITTSDATQAMSSGPRWRGSGRWSGPDLPGAGGQQLAPLGEVGGEEEGERDLGELAGLEVDRADAHPQRAPSGAPKPTPGTNGSISRTIPMSANVHL